MNIIEKHTIKQFHKDRIAQSNGNFAQAQGWKDKASQQVRFDAILSLAEFDDATILDIGCGYGELKIRLDENFANFKYTGIDQQPEFISYADQYFKGHQNTQFYNVDFANYQLPKADIIIASGGFAYHSSDDEYYFRMIKKFMPLLTRH